MLGWVTASVGLVGLLVGNLLNRSMEYRKWRRAERHKACAQLLEACQTTINLVAFRHAAPKAAREVLHDPMKLFAQLGGPRGRLGRIVIKPIAKILVRKMNPGEDGKKIDESLSGILTSLAAQAQEPMVDFLAERLGAGSSGPIASMRESAHRLGVAMESVELICPDPVVLAGRGLYDAALGLVAGEHTDDLDEKLKLYGQARRNFVLAARRDLVPGRFGRKARQTLTASAPSAVDSPVSL